jgi:hypothetical protein
VAGAVVKSVDHGYDALTLVVFGFGRPEVVVGILAKDAGRTEKDGTTLIDVGTWNEFGTETIPARSFIRAWFDQDQEEARRVLIALMKAVLAGKTMKEKALQMLGQWAQGRVQARMATSIPPPNAPSTVRQKGSTTTLIASGQLRSGISYGVRERT